MWARRENGAKIEAKTVRNSAKIEKSVDRGPLFRLYFYVAGLSLLEDSILLCFVNMASQYVVILPYYEEEYFMKRTFQPKKRHRAVIERAPCKGPREARCLMKNRLRRGACRIF